MPQRCDYLLPANLVCWRGRWISAWGLGLEKMAVALGCHVAVAAATGILAGRSVQVSAGVGSRVRVQKGPTITNKVFFDIEIDGEAAGGFAADSWSGGCASLHRRPLRLWGLVK